MTYTTEYEVWCQDCGNRLGTFPTREEAQQLIDEGLGGDPNLIILEGRVLDDLQPLDSKLSVDDHVAIGRAAQPSRAPSELPKRSYRMLTVRKGLGADRIEKTN